MVDSNVLPFIRVHSWWVLLPNWGTCVFSDHRGLRPGDVKIKDNTLDALLTRSKTTSDDKNVTSRPVHIESCCYLVSLSDGLYCSQWLRMKEITRLHTENYMQCIQKEMRYVTAYALQNRVLSQARSGTGKLFQVAITNYWTPH